MAKAQIAIRVAAFIPRPENPETGDLIEAAPIILDVNPSSHVNSKTIKKLRTLLRELQTCVNDHVFREQPKQEQKIILEETGITRAPEVQLFVPDALGRPVEVKQGLVDAQGIELADD